jgi:hypothetical protein
MAKLRFSPDCESNGTLYPGDVSYSTQSIKTRDKISITSRADETIFRLKKIDCHQINLLFIVIYMNILKYMIRDMH